MSRHQEGHHEGHRHEGTVKWFNEQKGYGFITQENGPDLFAHFRAITGSGYKTLREGDRVKFDITQGNKGPQAENIEVVDGGHGDGGHGHGGHGHGHDDY